MECESGGEAREGHLDDCQHSLLCSAVVVPLRMVYCPREFAVITGMQRTDRIQEKGGPEVFLLIRLFLERRIQRIVSELGMMTSYLTPHWRIKTVLMSLKFAGRYSLLR